MKKQSANASLHHHQSISYTIHFFLSSTFFCFDLPVDFLVSSFSFYGLLLFFLSLCVHWLTSFFLFRHCPLISCNVFNCATLQYCMQKTKIKQLKNSLTLFKKWAISCFKEICYQSTDRKPAFAK